MLWLHVFQYKKGVSILLWLISWHTDFLFPQSTQLHYMPLVWSVWLQTIKFNLFYIFISFGVVATQQAAEYAPTLTVKSLRKNTPTQTHTLKPVSRRLAWRVAPPLLCYICAVEMGRSVTTAGWIAVRFFCADFHGPSKMARAIPWHFLERRNEVWMELHQCLRGIVMHLDCTAAPWLALLPLFFLFLRGFWVLPVFPPQSTDVEAT